MEAATVEQLRLWTLLDWLKVNDIDTTGLPNDYADLRDEALARGLIHFHLLTTCDSEPFALGTDFYGESLEAVLDDMASGSSGGSGGTSG
jgi:hypothetical protein